MSNTPKANDMMPSETPSKTTTTNRSVGRAAGLRSIAIAVMTRFSRSRAGMLHRKNDWHRAARPGTPADRARERDGVQGRRGADRWRLLADGAHRAAGCQDPAAAPARHLLRGVLRAGGDGHLPARRRRADGRSRGLPAGAAGRGAHVR